jgi:uncharacterized membrane protein YdjX (TVP38/TMEM64 family)
MGVSPVLQNRPAMNSRLIRILVFCLLICAVVAGVCWLMFTERGAEIRDNPRHFVETFLGWIRRHPVHAGLWFFGVYILMTLLLLPCWSLQIMCGFALSRIFGILWGIIVAVAVCQVAATVAAIITFSFSHWLASDWFHKKVESRIRKLQSLDDKLGNNGFLLVMAVRLMHMIPFAFSNYAFGLLKITSADILIGTLLGGIPGVLLYVTLGAHPRMVSNWRFMTAMVMINVVLIIPIALRYLKPQWFKKIGVE